MRHGPEEVRWLKHRNSEAAAILRLSTMKSDQTSREDLRNWVDLGNDACRVPQLSVLGREPLELGWVIGSLLQDRKNKNHSCFCSSKELLV